MERLKQYCTDICFIDGLQTFVISPENYNAILKDSLLLKYLKKSELDIVPFMKITQKVGTDKLYLAFVHLPSKIENIQWIPVHCYKSENQYYHVSYRNSWMCRECGNIMSASIIMPMVESESTMYHFCRNKYPDVPLIFPKVKCPKCNKLLQNHLIILPLKI